MAGKEAEKTFPGDFEKYVPEKMQCVRKVNREDR